jgi:hypothetical protein
VPVPLSRGVRGASLASGIFQSLSTLYLSTGPRIFFSVWYSGRVAMGQLVQDVTGQGNASLGGSQPVGEIWLRLLTLGFYSTVYGVSPVRRVFQVGWVGLTEQADAGGFNFFTTVVWSRFLAHESEDFAVTYAAGNLPDTVYWDLVSGAEIEIQVFW